MLKGTQNGNHFFFFSFVKLGEVVHDYRAIMNMTQGVPSCEHKC